jgi:hypothetical protein
VTARSLVRGLASPRGPWVHLLVARDAAAALPPPPDGFVRRDLAGARCATRDALLDAIAGALAFPAHFGRNWDALEDCLTDLSWLPARGYWLVVTAADRLLAGEAEGYRTFIDLLGDVGRAWGRRATGHPGRPAVPFHTVLIAGPARLGARADWRLAPIRADRSSRGRPRRA